MRSCIRPSNAADLAAGLDEIRGSTPYHGIAHVSAWNLAGLVNPRRNRSAIRSRSPVQLVFSRSGRRDGWFVIIKAPGDQHGPDDPGRLVRHRDRGNLGWASRQHLGKPIFIRRFRACIADQRAARYDQQPADVAVAPLGDGPKACLPSRGILSRHKSQPCCELPGVAEG